METPNLLDLFSNYFNKSILISKTDKEIFYISPSNIVMGFDIKNESFFEPNSSLGFNLVKKVSLDMFNEQYKKTFVNTYQHDFDELQELKFSANSQSKKKNLGVLAFYSKERNLIYLWSLFTKKWEIQDALINRQYYANFEIIAVPEEKIESSQKQKNKYYEGLEDLGITEDDIVKLDIKSRDGSVHYRCEKLNCVVSYNFIRGYWYIASPEYQENILLHM